MPITDFATLLIKLRNGAKQKWPSLSDEDLNGALQAALEGCRGPNVKVGDLNTRFFRELTKRYGRPQA